MAIALAVDHLTSTLLDRAGFRHAFFTRQGGVSLGPYATLNFSYGVGDEAAHVDENFRRAERTLALEPGRLLFLSQVHGCDVVEISAAALRSDVLQQQGDGLTAADPELGLGVRTADCVPVLIACTKSGHAAAAHAGWRGLVSNVIAATVAKLAVEPSSLLAAIGPHIGVNAFEVSDDVAAQLQAAAPHLDVVRREPQQKPHVDLRRIARAQLEGAGIPAANIDDVCGCTYSEPDRFFSFRRDGAHSGRHISVIVPRSLR
jgi:polyphenol oxidase